MTLRARMWLVTFAVTLGLVAGGVVVAVDMPRTERMMTLRANAVPIKILVVGDSLMANLGDMPMLHSLLDNTGFAYQLYNAGTGGISTVDVWPAMAPLINAIHPDLTIIAIGTNDDMSGFQFGYYAGQPLIGGPKMPLQDFGQRMQLIFDKIRTWAPYTKILPAINQCNGPTAPGWIQMPHKNDAIYVHAFNMQTNTLMPQIAGFVNFAGIPPSYMGPDGVHPSTVVDSYGYSGRDYQQRQLYRAIAAVYGLPPIPDDPALTAHCNT